jgi:hypothetical protein
MGIPGTFSTALHISPAQKTPFNCWNMYTESLHSNGRGTDCIENKSRDF